MAVKDVQYRYYPSQERLVNVSNYLINPDHACPSPDNIRRRGMMSRPGDERPSSMSFGAQSVQPSSAMVRTCQDFDMRNICWSNHLLSVSDVLSLRHPVIVKVVRGYDGENGKRLAADQILQVYGCVKQRRVIAMDSQGRTLTIPVDHHLNLRHSTDSKESGRVRSLAQILSTFQLPVNVELVDDVTANGDVIAASVSGVTSQFSDPKITLQGISEQRFIQCNHIVNGWLDQSLDFVPEQLPLTFRLATGTKYTTADEWKDIRGMYSRSARHLRLDLVEGYEGIIYDDWISQSEPKFLSTPSSIPSDNSCPENEKHQDDNDDDYDDDSDDVDDDNDSDSTFRRSSCLLLWQQAALTQGSLPSLPTAVIETECCQDSPKTRTHSGSISPSHLSTESLQPSKSTESLLPRRSLDSGCVGGQSSENSAKRKSNVPMRLRRRKGDAKKQVAGHDVIDSSSKPEIELTNFRNFDDTRSRLQAKPVPQDKTSSLHSNGKASPKKSGRISKHFGEYIETKPQSGFGSNTLSNPMEKSSGNIFLSFQSKDQSNTTLESTAKGLNESGFNSLNPSDSFDKSLTNKQPDININKKSTPSLVPEPNNTISFPGQNRETINHRTSTDALSQCTGNPSRDPYFRSPGHYSSDLGIDSVVFGSDSDIGRMKVRKDTSKSWRSNSVGFLDSGLRLTNLKSINGNVDDDGVHLKTDCFLDPVKPRGTVNCATQHIQGPFYDVNFVLGSQGVVIPGEHRLSLDHGSESPWRNRTQTNGLMKLRRHVPSGTSTSTGTGSDLGDDGYGTESLSLTASLNTLTLTSLKRENAFYI